MRVKREIIITYDLEVDNDYEGFKNEIYDYFNYRQKEKKRIPNTTIVIELDTDKTLYQLQDEIIEEFNERYTIKKLLIIDSNGSILK